MFEQTYLESRTEVEIFSAYQLPHMQVRVKLFVLNEKAAKHLLLHSDPCQSPSCHMGSIHHVR